MFAAVYRFVVQPSHEEAFRTSWRELTLLIREHQGGLGSRLHQAGAHTYIAYAPWPDRSTWRAAREGPAREDIERLGVALRASCVTVETVFQLDVVEDLTSPPRAEERA